ncbi:MAG: glycosyltransferase, partial [Nocardiopsaceae bacterium]|nr:glycosyltransferase [Nocardiopsaceae bacterium]
MLVLGFVCAASFLAWLYLLIGHGGFWRTSYRLPPGAAEPSPAAEPSAAEPRPAAEPVAGAWPDVVAVVPARNEADVLPETLPKLLAQKYPGRFRVILVDDRSDDGTGKVAAGLGEKAVPGEKARLGDRPGAGLTVLPGQPRPDGWAGKVWAMSQGLAAAEDGDYLLFTDADIAWTPGALRRLVAAAEGGNRQLVSQMVR